MDPHVNYSNGKQRVEACGDSLPADGQAAVLPLEPGEGPLGLKVREPLCDWTPTWLSGLPHSFGDLGPDSAFAKSIAEVFGLIPFIRHEDLKPFARSAPCARADVEGIPQWNDLGPLIAIGGGRIIGPWHASTVGEAVDEDASTFSARASALTATFAWWRMHHPRRHRATASCRVSQPARAALSIF
jgi:hypothetical protein